MTGGAKRRGNDGQERDGDSQHPERAGSVRAEPDVNAVGVDGMRAERQLQGPELVAVGELQEARRRCLRVHAKGSDLMATSSKPLVGRELVAVGNSRRHAVQSRPTVLMRTAKGNDLMATSSKPWGEKMWRSFRGGEGREQIIRRRGATSRSRAADAAASATAS